MPEPVWGLGALVALLQLVSIIFNGHLSLQVSALRTEVVNLLRQHEQDMHYNGGGGGAAAMGGRKR